MAFIAAIKRVETDGVTGNHAYTGLGFQPKLLIFFTEMNSLNNGTIETYTRTAIGAASSPTERWAAGTAQDNNHGSGNTQRNFNSTKCIHTTSGSGTDENVADLVSLDADGFTLNFTTITNGYEFYVLCLGGADLSAKVGTFDLSSGTGSQAVTGIGFQPQGLILAYTKNDAMEGTEAHCTLVFGMGDGTRQNTNAKYDQDSAGIMNAERNHNNEDILNLTRDATTYVECDLTSLDSDGFTINRTTTTDTPRVGYIAFRGSSVRVDQFSIKTTTGS